MAVLILLKRKRFCLFFSNSLFPVLWTFSCGSSKHGVTSSQVVRQEPCMVSVFMCVCMCARGQQLCHTYSKTQVTSCLPECRFLSPAMAHTHTHT